LPKPHTPSAVPLFTGREFEIEEITNLMTDKSTRLLNIWGSPGFGKTSTAIEVAHHILFLGYPVYFFKLQGITSVDELLSQILSIFKSSLADLSLTPVDRLVSIFREISCTIFLIFDNLDDILPHVTDAVTRLFRIFDKFLDSNSNINILFTTRELLATMRDQVEGFQDVRIRPLSPASSVEYARRLLPSLSDSVVAKVARISSHVPLAMKLVASLVENNSEEMANNILEELNLSENLLEQLDSPYEKKMQRLFDTPFEQLALNDKHALISLTVFSSATVSKDAAIDVVSGETGVKLEAVRSLKTLVKKSLIDEDPNGKYYSIHPLIYSFLKAKQSDFENAFKSSRIRFCRYYLLLFERLNDDFLAGKSVDSPQLQDTMVYLSTAIHESITNDFESSQDLFRILSKSEIFLFLIGIPLGRSLDILDIRKVYDLAVETCSTQYTYPTYLKLHVSKYFQAIAKTDSFLSAHSDIQEDVRKDVMLLTDGSAAKLGCYEGILRILKGNVKAGVQRIEKHLDGLQKCADQQLIKCLCLQLLALFYSDLKEYSKSSNFSRKAAEVCAEVDNCSLFLIRDYDQTCSVTGKNDPGEQLIVFIHFLNSLSKEFSSDETKHYFLNFVYKLQQHKENDAFSSYYVYKIVIYADYLLAVLGANTGQEKLLDEKIDFLDDSLRKIQKYKDCSSSTDESLPTCERLLRCYMFKMDVQEHTKQQVLSVETCRNALDLSLEQYGEQHHKTALCYFKMGLAENDAENYISALNAFDNALHILTAIHDESNNGVADVYIGKGKTYLCTHKFESAIASFEEALEIKRKLFSEDTEEIAEILFLLGRSHRYLLDLFSALAALEKALQIRVKLYAEKRSLCMHVVLNYVVIGKVHCELGNVAEGIKCFESALKIPTDNEQQRLLAQCLTCMQLLNLKVDDSSYMELLHTSLPVMKEHYKSFLPIVYLTIGSKQLKSGKHEAGLAFLQEALDIDLDVTVQEHADIREWTVSCYIEIMSKFVVIRESKLARRTLDRALQIAESLPEGRQHPWLFRCYYLQGLVHIKKQEFVSAIEKLEHALLQLPNISDEAFDKFEEFACRRIIATAHYNKGTYEDALSSLYKALFIVKDRFPDGSEDEAEAHLNVASVAQKMKNRSLLVNNLRLAYKVYLNVLGKNHCKTEHSYIAYVRALIN
jgi:tetratricopeptide (TPR) repeat protein